MKLKKIASLALAGIMAVSMLTACGEGEKRQGRMASSGMVEVFRQGASERALRICKGERLSVPRRLADAQKLFRALIEAVRLFSYLSPKRRNLQVNL